MFRKIAKWLRFHWIWVDVASLGIGSLLVFLHYVFAESSRNATLELLPNIATEILGVWISVRIIDALIQRRDKYNAVRRRVVYECDQFVDNLGDITALDDRKTHEFRVNNKRFASKLALTQNYLFDDEAEILKQFVEEQAIIVRSIEKMVDLLQRVDNAEMKIEDQIRMLRMGPQEGIAGINMTGNWIDRQVRMLQPVKDRLSRFRNRIRNRTNDMGDELVSAITEFETASCSQDNRFAETVKNAAHSYHEAIHELIAARNVFQAQASRVGDLASKIHENISEETELD